MDFRPVNSDALAQKEMQELTDALFERPPSEEETSALEGKATTADIRHVMTRAVESRQYGRLGFMKHFFKDGSVSQLMVESSSRIVWINDWYPLKDLTYAIAVDQRLKRVLVVFRGAITKADWQTVSQISLQSIPNPVADMPGTSELLVFSGFYRYLFRKRKDTNTTKYDEIANLAHKYGCDMIGADYNLVVTGHSLGAGLTTFFSLYASTDERFTKNGPVKSFTFGGPYCGDHNFADAFRHQESKGKLQLVRIVNNNDMVPHLPFNFRIGKRGCRWRHVGIGVILPPIPWTRRWRPRVQYIGKQNWFASIAMGYQNNVLLHFPWLQPWNFAKIHTLFELQDRLMYGIEQQNLGGEFDLLQKPVDELYETLKRTGFSSLKETKAACVASEKNA